jgi:hypothetical protein
MVVSSCPVCSCLLTKIIWKHPTEPEPFLKHDVIEVFLRHRKVVTKINQHHKAIENPLLQDKHDFGNEPNIWWNTTERLLPLFTRTMITMNCTWWSLQFFWIRAVIVIVIASFRKKCRPTASKTKKLHSACHNCWNSFLYFGLPHAFYRI